MNSSYVDSCKNPKIPEPGKCWKFKDGDDIYMRIINKPGDEQFNGCFPQGSFLSVRLYDGVVIEKPNLQFICILKQTSDAIFEAV